MYALYEPHKAACKESRSLKGLARLKYDREHKDSLEKYPEMRERMYKLLNEGEKITPKQWRQEIKVLRAEYESIGGKQAVM